SIVLGMVDKVDREQLASMLEVDGTEFKSVPLEECAKTAAKKICENFGSYIGLSLIVERNDSGLDMAAALSTKTDVKTRSRSYAGPPENVSTWGSTTAFDLLRRWLIQNYSV
ncbi:MAG: hypothetical protein JXA42_07880, partial [Anaerolineales bacterium]|nr:hypothetical protein [Anaerolineales bacterium]